ncbi:ATP-dependent acyl-CoA ligase [Bacillus tianshenii]|nr:ATP-dependent acyl-CoA ligase [Bacillus tianshenii]
MMKRVENIPQLLRENAKDIPSELFLQFEDLTYTFKEMDDYANQAANAFKSLGVQKGQHVAFMMKNSPDYLALWFGLAKLGAVMVPINTNIKGEGLAYILQHSDSELLIMDEEFEEEHVRLKTEHALAVRTSSIGEMMQKVAGESKQFEDISASIDKSHPMAIIYTSGTTGLPKGVVIPHYSYVHTGWLFQERMMNLTKEDKLYTCLPLFHANAQQFSVMGALVAGIPLALSRKFSASRFWKDIQRYEPTVFNYIGSMMTILMKNEPTEHEANNSVKKVFGAACPKEIWEQFEKRFDLTIVEGYGLTETGAIALCNPLDAIRVGSIGTPMDHVEVKVVGEGGKQLPPNENGEIVVKETIGHTMFQEYYKMPEKTAETVQAGWFHTGDRGCVDNDGYFYFKDRIKDCIRYRGENISSFEIERAVNKHPFITESAAVGVPSDLGEEDVKVFLVLQDGKELDYESFIRFCETEMAYYMVPRYVEIISELPKTATQRTQKFQLRKQGNDNAWDRVKENITLNR